MGLLSNIDVYLAIAIEAHASMQAALARAITPKPNGEAGYIMRSEPDRRSFKDAMITIAFTGMYIEALLFIKLQQRFGRAEALKIDRRPYEQRLQSLGINNADLQNRLMLFRDARRDLVHEKALTVTDLEGHAIHEAQGTADRAMILLHDLRRLLATEGSQ